jgi:hypothetical protein
MVSFDKILARIINNPRDVEFKLLDRLLKKHGFKCRQPGKGSSHYTYYHHELEDILTIPYDRPVKAVYVKKAIAAIQKLKGSGFN